MMKPRTLVGTYLTIAVAVWSLTPDADQPQPPARCASVEAEPPLADVAELVVRDRVAGLPSREAPPIAGRPSVTLLVRTEADEPVVGARVFVADSTQIEAKVDGDWFYVHRDPELVLTQCGTELATGDDGCVGLPATCGITFVCARLGDAFGLVRFDADQPVSERVVVIAADAAITVIVEDAMGSPRPEVPVLLVESWFDFEGSYGEVFRGSVECGTAEVIIPHARWLTRAGRADPVGRDYYLRPGVLGLCPGVNGFERIAVDPGRLPREPIHLVVPQAIGAVRVRIEDPDGSQHQGHARVWAGDGIDSQETRWTETGEVIFPAVLHDAWISFEVTFPEAPDERLRVHSPGPRAAGGDALVIARRQDPRLLGPLLRGQVIDENGVLFANGRLALDDTAGSGRPSKRMPTLSTDDEGRFEFQVRAGGGSLHPHVVLRPLDAEGRVRPDLAADFRAAAPLQPGPYDLGVLRLRVVPLLVRGQVVAEDGSVLPGRSILARVRRTAERAHGSASRLVPEPESRFVATSDAAGRFAIHVDSVDLTGELQVASQTDWTPFQRGDDVVLRIARSGSMALRVLLDDDIPVSRIQIDAQREGERALTMWADDSGYFRRDVLAPGAWRLTVHARYEVDVPVMVLDDVWVPEGGACADPRIDPIDLRGRFIAARLRCVDEHGSAVVGSCLAPAIGPEPVRLSNVGQALFVSGRSEGITVFVAPDGCRPVLLERVRGEQQVVVRAGLPAHIRVDLGEQAALLDHYRVQVTATRISSRDDPWARYARALAPYDGVLENGDAELRLPIAGVYALSWFIESRAMLSGVPRDDHRVLTVREDAENLLVVRPTAAELASVLREVGGPP